MGLRTAPRTALALAFATAGLAGAGCAGTVRSASTLASQAATPVVIDESLASFEDPANQARIERIVGSPEMQRAIQETARAAVEGALQTGHAGSGSLEQTVSDSTARITDALAETLAADVRDKIVPAAAEGMRAELRAGLSDEDSRAMQRTIELAVARATSASLRSAADEFPRSVAPVMRAAIVESLEAPEFHRAVASIISDATRSALLSSRDIIEEIREEGGRGPFAQVFDRIERMLLLAVAATFFIGLGLGGLVVFGVRERRWRKAVEDGGPPRLDRTPTHAT